MYLNKSYTHYFFLLCLASIYIYAWAIQSNLLLKDDVSWLIHVSHLVLNGGDYLRDFFETNPPLIFYLYRPTIALSKLLALNDTLALRLYIFLLSSLIIYLCYLLAKKIFSAQPATTPFLFTLCLAIILLILPLLEFGQREHLFIILTFPYLLLTSYRLQHQQTTISSSYAIIIGLLAASGFAIKPFFLLNFFFIECYYYQIKRGQHHKHIKVKPETLIIIVFLLLYANFIIGRYHSYFFSVIPLTAQFYYQTIGHPWRIVLLNPLFLYLSSVFVLYYYLSRSDYCKPLYDILLFALISNLLIYAMQKLSWYYHLLPALALGIVIQLLSFISCLTSKGINKRKFLVLFLTLIILSFPLYYINHLYLLGKKEKNNFSGLITYLHKNQHRHPIYFLSPKRHYMALIDGHEHDAHYPRLEYLGWMHGYFRGLQQIAVEDFFVKITAEDINKNKPQLIFVDQAPYYTVRGVQIFNCLNVLLKYKTFKQAWAPYHYFTTIEQPFTFKFDIYQRT